MIKCEITRNENDAVIRFIVKGHAGQDEYGSDIVCSAVSAVVYTALGALDELAGCSEYYDVRETDEGISVEDEHIEFVLPDNLEEKRFEKAQVILESMIIGLKQIEHIYDEYVSVTDRR